MDGVQKNIKGILFDVDGTLYHQKPLRIIMAALLGFYLLRKPSRFVRTLKVVTRYRKAQEILRKSKTRQKQCHVRQLALTAEATGEDADFISEVVGEWFEKRPLPFISLFRRRGLEQAMRAWQKNGLRLGAYSDYPLVEKIRVLGLSNYLTTMVSPQHPDIEGFKPNTNGFEVAAREMGLPPSDILYVGDRPEVDGCGALLAGMHVIILRGRLSGPLQDYDSCHSFSKLMQMVSLG